MRILCFYGSGVNNEHKDQIRHRFLSESTLKQLPPKTNVRLVYSAFEQTAPLI